MSLQTPFVGKFKRPLMVSVGSSAELQGTITRYISQGYTVASQTPESATLLRKKQIKMGLMILLLLLCIAPGIIYLIYAGLFAKGDVVMISVQPQGRPVSEAESSGYEQPTDAVPATANGPTFTHSGGRFILGFSGDSYGIWDKEHPGPPIQRFPKDEQGWQAAWQQFVVLDPDSAAGSGPPDPPDSPS